MAKKTKKMGPSEGLTEDLDDLNKTFYSGSPVEYIRQRFFFLLAIHQMPEALKAAIPDPRTMGDVNLINPNGAPLPLWSDVEAQKRFAVLEAQVLAHHAIEAMLRMFISHIDNPDCPWIALSEIRVPGALFERLDALIAEDEEITITHVRKVFEFLNPSNFDAEFIASLPAGYSQASFEPATAADWIGFFANYLRDGAARYNAAKHGLALNIKNASDLRLEVPSQGFSVGSFGSAITYLDKTSDSERHRWVERTDVVSVEKSSILIQIALAMFDSLWSRNRREKAWFPSPLNELCLPSTQAALSVQDGMTIASSSRTLAYEGEDGSDRTIVFRPFHA